MLKYSFVSNSFNCMNARLPTGPTSGKYIGGRPTAVANRSRIPRAKQARDLGTPRFLIDMRVAARAFKWGTCRQWVMNITVAEAVAGGLFAFGVLRCWMFGV